MRTLLWRDIVRSQIGIRRYISRLLLHLHIGHVVMIHALARETRITLHDSGAEMRAERDNQKTAALRKKQND